jgi:hypothetical protein
VRVDCFEVNQVERGGRNIDKLIKLLNYFFSWPIYQIKQNAAATVAAAAAPTAAAAAPTAATSVVVTPWAKIRQKSPHKQKPPSHPPAVPAPAPAYHR